MAFICNKIINGKKYAYEITSTWCQEALKIDPLSASKIDPPFDQYKG